MFRLHDVVRLKRNNSKYSIPSSAIGTIVDVHGYGEAYTVEFIDVHGNTYEASLNTIFYEDDLEFVVQP